MHAYKWLVISVLTILKISFWYNLMWALQTWELHFSVSPLLACPISIQWDLLKNADISLQLNAFKIDNIKAVLLSISRVWTGILVAHT